jgi:hypothetical protein
MKLQIRESCLFKVSTPLIIQSLKYQKHILNGCLRDFTAQWFNATVDMYLGDGNAKPSQNLLQSATIHK